MILTLLVRSHGRNREKAERAAFSWVVHDVAFCRRPPGVRLHFQGYVSVREALALLGRERVGEEADPVDPPEGGTGALAGYLFAFGMRIEGWPGVADDPGAEFPPRWLREALGEGRPAGVQVLGVHSWARSI
jgi:hypothetical protein